MIWMILFPPTVYGITIAVGPVNWIGCIVWGLGMIAIAALWIRFFCKQADADARKPLPFTFLAAIVLSLIRLIMCAWPYGVRNIGMWIGIVLEDLLQFYWYMQCKLFVGA